jgi:membrane protease YdiL (CAAX protease family)
VISPASLAAGALAAAAVLYLLWPEEGRTITGRARAVFFTLLAALVAFSLFGRQEDRMSSASTARAFEAYTRGLIAARSVEASRWTDQWLAGFVSISNDAGVVRRQGKRSASSSRPDPIPKLRRQALRAYAEAIHLAPDSALFRRQYAILLAHYGHRDEALRQFEAIGDRRVPAFRLSSERQLWERLYGPRPPRPAELPALAARLRQLDLGWFEYLVLASVYRRDGLARQADSVAEKAGREAAVLNGALGVLVLGMLGTAVLGLGLVIAVLVRWRKGRLWFEPATLCAGPAPLLEAFVLYLFLFALPAFFPMLGWKLRWLGPHRTVAWTVALLLGSDLLSLAALGYLWARLRALGLSLAEIGLHARKLGGNLFFGLGGYAASLPLVIGAGLLATWLGHRYFPQVAPPFHPIEALTLTAPSRAIRLALLIIAAVGAPILEEIFFRGLLYGALRRRFGVAWGILISAAVFSSLHPQLPLGFLPIFVLGAILAGLYEWRQSLIPGMVLHAMNNGVIWIYLNLLFPPR